MSEERELQPGLVIAGRYRIERRVGQGGMGSVYLVQHVHTEERFALKVLHKAVISDTNALDRFRREAKTPARIDSEYVVRVTDADAAAELGGAPFLVMEFLRGQDIDQRLESQGPMAPSTTVHLLRQAARALDKAHALGIVHRDLKPENLFVVEREDGTLVTKILDFGIAKFTANPDDVKVSQATRPGAVFGTPLFMSPEQALDSSKVSSATDIWALGLIAHRMLSGQDYWTATSLTALIAQIAYEPMVPPSERGAPFGPEYDAWFLRCCARPPEERFASAGEAVRALAHALGIGEVAPVSSLRAPLAAPGSVVSARTSVSAISDTQLATTRPVESRGKGGMIGAAIAVLAVGGIAAFLVLSSGGGEPAADGAHGAGPTPGRASSTAPLRAEPGPTASPLPADAASGTPRVEPVGSASAQPLGSTETVDPAASAAPSAGASAGVPEGTARPPRPSASPTGGTSAPPRPPVTAEPKPSARPPASSGSDPFPSRF